MLKLWLFYMSIPYNTSKVLLLVLTLLTLTFYLLSKYCLGHNFLVKVFMLSYCTYMIISCAKIFLLPWSGAFVFHEHILFWYDCCVDWLFSNPLNFISFFFSFLFFFWSTQDKYHWTFAYCLHSWHSRFKVKSETF